MKDYCETEYQRKNFVIKYEIINDNTEIRIDYADGESYTIPYTVNGELRLLKTMKKQVESFPQYTERLKQDRNLLLLREGMLLSSTALATVVLTYLGMGAFELGSAGTFLIGPLSMNALAILAAKRRFDQVGEKLDELQSDISDYQKSLFYIEHAKVFDNERILRKDVSSNIPKKAHQLIEDRASKHLSEEVPSINLNNLDLLSLRELKKTYEASLQSHGPEKVIKKTK